MRIVRRFTEQGQDAYARLAFTTTNREIRNPDGSVVFEARGHRGARGVVAGRRRHPGAEVLPQARACPPRCRPVRRGRRARPGCGAREPDEEALAALPERRAHAARPRAQVFHRLAGCWTYWGWKGGYFDTEEDARAFYDEMCYMLAAQMAAPNSPQWFNTGLHWAYGIDGPGAGPLLRRLRRPAS